MCTICEYYCIVFKNQRQSKREMTEENENRIKKIVLINKGLQDAIHAKQKEIDALSKKLAAKEESNATIADLRQQLSYAKRLEEEFRTDMKNLQAMKYDAYKNSADYKQNRNLNNLEQEEELKVEKEKNIILTREIEAHKISIGAYQSKIEELMEEIKQEKRVIERLTEEKRKEFLEFRATLDWVEKQLQDRVPGISFGLAPTEEDHLRRYNMWWTEQERAQRKRYRE